MKKNISRIFSILLAIVIATASFATAAFAAPVIIENAEVVQLDETALCEDEAAARVDKPTHSIEEHLKGRPWYTEIWLTGCFNGNNWSTRHLLEVANKRVTPKFKVYTYRCNGSSSSGRFSILVTTPQDSTYKRRYNGKTSGDTITLDKGYSQYYVQISRYSDSPSNVANCYYWAFKATSSDTGWAW